MKKIAIFGAGGFGREVACLIEKINQREPQWDIVGFYDDSKPVGTTNEMGTVLGGMDALNSVTEPLAVVIAIGTPATLKAVHERITNPAIYFPNIIDPDVVIQHPATVHFGQGNIVANKCAFTVNITIGDFNVFNGTVGVGHDATIGNYNVVMPSVKLAGDVHLGDLNFIGMMTGVVQGVKIGNNTRIGAGSIVMRKTRDGHLYMGNPARKVEL